ncbi:MAG: GTPase ObgE [Bacteroidales bacterium]|jgi:GTP-binding protein|nr:GTPase ObgE [Bacteroidales bacterium]
MAESNFVDYVKIFCRSGNGGAGSAHFHRDRFTIKGGPDGGDGGRGGHVVLRGNSQLWTLIHLKYRRHLFAGNGENGGSALKTGADGEDKIIEVPLGTVVHDAESGKMLFEITRHGETQILAKGGRGGLGNDHFKSSVRQAPHYSQPGESGEEGWKVLELKILADVGLVGFPNAGKSTLLSVISAAKPEIADYPFTTLTPNLGMVAYRDHRSFVVADIPGIIEDAHLGKGLGTRFLRHIERNSILLFMIPADSKDIEAEYRILLNELKLYNPELSDKKRLIAVTKCDLLDEELLNEMKISLESLSPVFISAVSGEGIVPLKDRIWQLLIDQSDLQ